jgi:hypothetical protein
MIGIETEFEVATHLKCPEAELGDKLRLFAMILEDLGAPDLTAEWLSSIMWESDGSGFGYLGSPVPLTHIRLNGEVVTARPHILGFTEFALPGTTAPWVEFSLLFEGDWIILYFVGDEERWQYVPGVGRAVWSVIQAYARRSPDSAVFFNVSPLVSEPWSALIGRGGHLWGFDTASVPDSLAEIFQPVPQGYSQTVRENRIGFARDAFWQVPPWDE